MSKTFAEDDLDVFAAMMPKTAVRIREHLEQQQATIAKLEAEREADKIYSNSKDKLIAKLEADVAFTKNQFGMLLNQCGEKTCEITKLRAELKADNEWVSVEDRLPLNEGDLPKGGHESVEVMVWTGVSVYWDEYAIGGMPRFWGKFGHSDTTHWKPITPPKGE